MRTFKIPFTKYAIGLDKNLVIFGRDERKKANEGRGLFFGRGVSSNPARDMTGFKISVQSFYTAFRNNGDIFGCIREICKTVGSAGHSWMDTSGKIVETSSAVSKVMGVLNYEEPWRRTQALIIRDKKVSGNAYLAWISNEEKTKHFGLQRIDPRSLAIVIDANGVIWRYIQRVNGQRDSVVFTPEEIIHIRDGEDPDNPAFGFSPIEPVLWEVRTAMSANVANYYFFQNDAQPATVYLLDESLKNQEEKQKALDFIRENFAGPENRGKPMALSHVKEVKTIGISHQDMQYIEGNELITEKICTALDVPKALLGYTKGMTFNNVLQLTKNFYSDTVRPEEIENDDMVNEHILPKLGLEKQLRYETVPKKFDEESDLEKRAREMCESGIFTMRQAKQYAGLGILPEDEIDPNFDKHIIHRGVSAVLLEDVGVSPEPIDTTDKDAVRNFIDALHAHYPEE